MSETYNRDFKGVWIPKEIWLNEELSIIEKIMLVEINSLDNENGCYAGNEHFAKFFGITTIRVSQIIKKLKDYGYVYEESFDGRKRILKTSFKINFKADLNESLGQPQSLFEGSVKEKFKHNNTVSNTLNKPINNKKNDSLFSESAARVIVYLNNLTGHSYNPENELHQKHIIARLKDKYTVDELLDIAAYKYVEWKGTKMEIHLVPKTLYNKENANKYRDQVAHAKKTGMTEAQIRGEKNKSVTNDWVKGFNSIK